MGGRLGRRAFGIWFGLFVPPMTVGAMALAFGHGWAVGTLTAAVCLGWVVETGRTTCRRCWAYGTAGCGLPSLVAPVFGQRLPADSLPLARVRFHYWVDVGGAVFLNGLYLWLCPAVAPLVAAWTVGAWLLVGRPKRFHGLLPRLRQEGHHTASRRFSLPVVDARTGRIKRCS